MFFYTHIFKVKQIIEVFHNAYTRTRDIGQQI